MDELRKEVIKLAMARPELQSVLVPILRNASDPKYEDYVKRMRKNKKKPMMKEDWESKVLGKGKKDDNASKDEGMGDTPQYTPKGSFTKKVQSAKKKLDSSLGKVLRAKIELEDTYNSIGDEIGLVGEIYDIGYNKDTKELAIKYDGDKRKVVPLADAGKAGDAFVKERTKWEKASKTYQADKKAFGELKAKRKTFGKLEDADIDELESFAKAKKGLGKKLTDSQLMQKFLSKASPETKERMKGVSPAEFKKIMAAIMDEEE